MPVRDANLNLSPQASDLPLIATDVLSACTVDLEGTPLKGLCVRVNANYTVSNTLAAGLATTFQVIIHGASSTPVTSSDPIVGQMDAAYVASSETAGKDVEFIVPFTTNYRYVRAEFDISAAASDSMSWSAVEAFITENVGLAWTRDISFH